MTKFSFVFLLCLSIFGSLSAQTDSVAPPPAQPSVVQPPVVQPDTAVLPKPIHHRDTAAHRIDSLAKLRRLARLDSLRRDSLAIVLKAATRRDSLLRVDSLAKMDSVTARRRAEEARENAIPFYMFWEAALKKLHAYNFTGKPMLPDIQVHQPQSKDSLFYLLVGILFFFALVRIFFEKYFNNLMTLFFRVSLRQQQIREQVLQAPLPSLLLNILFIVTAGLYATFLLHFSELGARIHFWTLYVNCMAGLAIIYLVKFVVLKFCGWVLNISRATDIYIFVVFLANKMLGIFLLPFLIIITFSGLEVREVFVTLSLVMVFILFLYRIFAAYRPVRNEIKLTPFHFLLYLCAFEIAPLLLIYKVLLTYLEKVY